MTSTIKKMITNVMILGSVEIVVFFMLFGYRGAMGVLAGTIGACINIVSLWYDVKKCVKKRRKMSLTGYLSRYTFSGAVMVFGSIFSLPALFGAFFGLMNEKIAAFLSWR
ncbi:MAG: hypothetical protein PWQ72_2057 [Pseudothermotoga sp.]|nr:hypothetical protein [Pseudothermotoga sp.]